MNSFIWAPEGIEGFKQAFFFYLELLTTYTLKVRKISARQTSPSQNWRRSSRGASGKLFLDHLYCRRYILHWTICVTFTYRFSSTYILSPNPLSTYVFASVNPHEVVTLSSTISVQRNDTSFRVPKRMRTLALLCAFTFTLQGNNPSLLPLR